MLIRNTLLFMLTVAALTPLVPDGLGTLGSVVNDVTALVARRDPVAAGSPSPTAVPGRPGVAAQPAARPTQNAPAATPPAAAATAPATPAAPRQPDLLPALMLLLAGVLIFVATIAVLLVALQRRVPRPAAPAPAPTPVRQDDDGEDTDTLVAEVAAAADRLQQRMASRSARRNVQPAAGDPRGNARVIQLPNLEVLELGKRIGRRLAERDRGL